MMESHFMILHSDSPSMHLCDICPKPGRCCSNFILFGIGNVDDLFHKDTWKEEAAKETFDMGLPYFKPVLAVPHAMPYDDSMVRVEFSCTNLLDGRCGIYDERPNVCRKYVPASDQLCVFGDVVKLNPSEGEWKVKE